MHGAGNDYIYVYQPTNPIPDPAKASIAWSRPHFGIGSDGLILIDKSDNPEADFTMRIFNNDGSEAKMCGNGVRCVAKYVYDHHLTDKTTIAVDTLSGIKVIQLHLEDGIPTAATVDMGEPSFDHSDRLSTLSLGSSENSQIGSSASLVEELSTFNSQLSTYVSMGNPHVVHFVDDVTNLDVAALGRRLEYEAVPDERCNIEFATVRPDGTIRMRVWERGSGITLACGTGACATAVAACLTGRTGRESRIEMDGGTLYIRWRESDNHVLMTGPAATVFEGEIEMSTI